MKKRVISGCVTVTGPPFAICCQKLGDHALRAAKHVTESRRLEVRAQRGAVCCKAWQAISGKALARAHHVVNQTCAGEKRSIYLHNSEPIDPPAPVTITTPP
jgi:hypothetical protein